jgi:glutamine amidotransferase
MIVIIDYGLGNLNSIANMLKKVGCSSITSSDKAVIEKADKIILPGVGAFDNGMENLSRQGLIPVLNDIVLNKKVPVLGICLGMQLFSKKSEEGKLSGLGWLDCDVIRFQFNKDHPELKIPHMGWNYLKTLQDHPLVAGLNSESRFYFIHSYYLKCSDQNYIVAETNHGLDFPSVVAKENIMGVQFHPEKSHKFGMGILKNFAGNIC